MRYEDWTFREAESRLGEHRDLREALHLRSVSDYTTLYRFLQRLDDDTVERGPSRLSRVFFTREATHLSRAQPRDRDPRDLSYIRRRILACTERFL